MDLTPFPADAPRRLLVGFSGGRDSTALLHRLATLPDAPWAGLRAIHVHHGLHAGADRWAQQCEAQARDWNVDCAVRRVAVKREGRGLEDAARQARYAAFDAERRADECLVLAHHRDDQAETLLLALLRGSGERGLSAMRDFTVDARGPIWRPLLATPGAAVADYAAQHELSWIEDPSNRDERLSRNQLRYTVMPLLRRHWPQADEALAASAQRLAEADGLLRRCRPYALFRRSAPRARCGCGRNRGTSGSPAMPFGACSATGRGSRPAGRSGIRWATPRCGSGADASGSRRANRRSPPRTRTPSRHSPSSHGTAAPRCGWATAPTTRTRARSNCSAPRASRHRSDGSRDATPPRASVPPATGTPARCRRISLRSACRRGRATPCPCSSMRKASCKPWAISPMGPSSTLGYAPAARVWFGSQPTQPGKLES
jgi:tRNA(Ile)-lysidine synthase